MFTSDDLEAAGRRMAQRPVEAVPLLADLEREAGKRKQNARLLGGMSVATAMLVGIGALTLLNAGDDQVQIVAASPVPEVDQVLAGPDESDGQRSAGVIDVDEVESTDVLDVTDEATSEGERLGSDAQGDSGGVATAEDKGDTPVIAGGDSDDDDDDDSSYDDYDDSDDNDDDDSDDDYDSDDDDSKDDGDFDDSAEEEDRAFTFGPDGFMLFDDQRHAPLLGLDIYVGDEAATQAATAAAKTDETRTVNGRQVWIDRFDWPEDADDKSRQRNQRRVQAVTVSAWIDDDRFMQATGHAKLEEMLVEAVGSGDGGIWLGSDDEWDRFDREWLPLPPNLPRVEDWDEIEDWADLEDWDDIERFSDLDDFDDLEDLKKQLEKWEHFDSWDDFRRLDRIED